MGIPKFFRYISERWPLISQLINDSEIAEFDNLYLDMNSILHNCTHKDSDISHHLTEDEMFLAIFNYIEHLFTLVRPKKLFYMAIDGVAPRAKMNQQRARRFKTALTAEQARKKALEQGLTLPEEGPFDSNAITPGTEFMAKITEQLKYFIRKKVSEDSSWQNIEIILSGHEVPGEGEHKIMEQIRYTRSQKDYDPNTRHCLYGLDADLIMLGLLSHDPHFAILREEVTFGRQSKKSKELYEQNFYLLHLSLVREYLEIEFDDVKDLSSVPFDFERVLDDFIFINFFIGNDFLPELPSLLINDGALPVVIESYKRFLKKTTSYITDSGIINFECMKLWLSEISVFEYEKFEVKALDVDWFNSQLSTVGVHAENDDISKLTLTEEQKKLLNHVKSFILEAISSDRPSNDTPIDELPKQELPPVSTDSLAFIQALAGKTWMRVIQSSKDESKHFLVLDLDGIPEDEDEESHDERLLNVGKVLKQYEKAPVIKKETREEEREIYSRKFRAWRNNYYRKKFNFSSQEIDHEVPLVAENYLEGLQWVLLYYYRGAPSWSWYYRYHYAPRITDVHLALDKKIEFDKGKPFSPLQQLMAVLPARSRSLVPPAYRTLMTDELSPIIDFYPHDFEQDLNGKKNDWEAVVKIPFIDESRLIAALKSRENQLTEAEQKRNEMGSELQFIFNPQVDELFPSSSPGHFLDIVHCHCVEIELDPRPDVIELDFGLKHGVKLGQNSLAGFPSLKTIPFTSVLENANVQVFQQPSRNESVIISIQNLYANDTASDIAEKIVGTSVYVGWPFLREARVEAVSDEMFRYSFDRSHPQSPINQEPHPTKELDTWKMKAARLNSTYYNISGVKIGEVRNVIHVKHLKGMLRVSDGSYVKEFGGEETIYATQTLVENVTSPDERYEEKKALPVEQEYPIDSRVLFLGQIGYGNPVTIIGHSNNKMNIKLMKIEGKEVLYGRNTAEFESKLVKYVPSYEVAKIVNLHPLLLSKISAKMLVFYGDQKYDIGLKLKHDSKRKKVLGYTRKATRGWEFTSSAISLIKEYVTEFRPIIKALTKEPTQKGPVTEIKLNMPPNEGKALLKKAVAFAAEKSSEFETVDFETEGLSRVSIAKIEDFITRYIDHPVKVREIEYKNIPREALLQPSAAYHQLRTQSFNLGDRVVSALNFGKVKLYNRGIVIGIESSAAKVSLTVLFDREFDQGTTLNGLCKTRRGLKVDAGSVINLTTPQLVFHPKNAASLQNLKNGNRHLASNGNGARPAAPIPSVWNRGSGEGAIKSPRAMTKPTELPSKKSNAPTKILQKPTNGKSTDKPPTNGTTTSIQTDAEKNAQASNELMAMLKQPKVESSEIPDNNEVLNSFKGRTNVDQSRRNVLGTVMGTYGGAPVSVPLWTPGHQFVPMKVDQAASNELMAQLSINDDSSSRDESNTSNGRGGHGRGGYGGRGRGKGRGRGRGRGGRARG